MLMCGPQYVLVDASSSHQLLLYYEMLVLRLIKWDPKMSLKVIFNLISPSLISPFFTVSESHTSCLDVALIMHTLHEPECSVE